MNKIYLFLILILFLLASCANNYKEVDLLLDYIPNTNHIGFYVAQEKGFYKDLGLNVNIVPSVSSTVEQAVSENVVDFGVSYEETTTMSRDKGLDVVSIYAILKENTSGFISNAEKNIKKPSDLNNKTYCGYLNGVNESIISSVALAAGVDPSSIEFINLSTNYLTTQTNKCDFFWEYAGWGKIEADLEKINYNYIPLIDYGVNFYSPVIITSQNYINNNYDVVNAFVEGTIKGYEYSAKHKDEATDIFLKYNKGYDKELIRQSLDFLGDYFADEKYGYQNEEVWSEFTTFLYTNEQIDEQELKGVYTNEFVNNYYQS